MITAGFWVDGRSHFLWMGDRQDDKIWIQQDRTDTGIAEELVEFGVPKTDIVLAFKSGFTRKFTEYAVS